MKRSLTILYASLLLVAIGISVQAQISIPTNGYLPSPGTTQETASSDSVDQAFFDAAVAGSGNQTWDFSGVDFPDMYTTLVVEPSTAPFPDSFPGANVVTLNLQGSGSADSMWSYTVSLPTSLSFVGSAAKVSGFGWFVETYDTKTPDFVFPLQYGNTWTTVSNKSSSSFGVLAESFDTTFNEVDAWGTITYDGQTVNCLRVAFTERITVIQSFNGTPISTDVSTLEGAFFIGAGPELLAVVEKSSVGGFTWYYGSISGSLLGTPTDVRENDRDNLPEGFGLAQNYPNPFNPTTEIQFSLPSSGQVRLEVYNVLGQLTNVLVDRYLSAGSYTAEWNGTDQSGAKVSSGVYFYRLTTGEFSEARKMLLLK
ncbi:T9SS type A sorting domain-containing protein [bacterium]|nr:T9SS type A sorting domain-containing protein [bacterium]